MGYNVSDSVVALGAVTAFVLAWANAANDIGNAVGTAVGAKVMTLRQALIYGCLFEFLGGVLMGTEVAKSIGGDIIDLDYFDSDPALYARAMVCVLAAAGSTTLLATFWGLPVSATHGIVSAIVTAAMMSYGAEAVDSNKVAFTVVSWIATPLLGLVFSWIMVYYLNKFIFSNPIDSERCRLSIKAQPTLMGATAAIVSLFIMLKGPHYLASPPEIAFPVAVGVGILAFFGTIYYQKRRPFRYTLDNLPDGGKDSLLRSDDIEYAPLGNDTEEEDPSETPFRMLVMISALTVAFAHGANDLGNSVGPFAMILDIRKNHEVPDDVEVPFWLLIVGAGTFCIGIVTLGYKTIMTLSENITKLSPHLSFSSQIATAVAVLLASFFGLPVSTSHCLVGAILGAGLAEQRTGKPVPVNAGTLKRIVLTWFITIPAAAAVLAALYAIAGYEEDS
eukprot:TRINITY_DN4391_c0_g1::TRINITY_DN4391_c0_g1_i1::g.21170::m.21170 TRINITY_DN4391_c0_g1::TRINITY_DN4391_c0_g1_i1::g.21170  ORF type:complete len:448 (-),score=167.98,sp/P45268/Y1604_HAEIN/30.61/6e-55,PHO4/PF01384.15/1.1e-89,FA_FANCE/PF11510.3/0.16 TRINITY_DN4391_c0_g1_i1:520-1863(-)